MQATASLQALRAELLKQGAEDLHARFAGLAREHSDCASAKKGGDLGTLEKEEMDEAFEAAALALPEGGVSEVVSTDSGCHIIMAAHGPRRARHILVKHSESSRVASWRDPNGDAIGARSIEQVRASAREPGPVAGARALCRATPGLGPFEYLGQACVLPY